VTRRDERLRQRKGTLLMNKSRRNSSHRQARGFSLVEVLVALIVMSVGMLGIASLYVQSMQAGRTSLFRHNAVTLAGDVADRIRANPTAGAVYAGAGANFNCIAQNVNCIIDETRNEFKVEPEGNIWSFIGRYY
jgi:prepilin-type N-terminal cleavage/methylation domain-containing protein